MKLVPKDNGGLGQYWATHGTRKWSVVHLGELMRPVLDEMPFMRTSGIFIGWEAAEVVGDDMDFEHMTRADSWEELEKLLVDNS